MAPKKKTVDPREKLLIDIENILEGNHRQFNMFFAAGIDHRETRICSFLASLLDPKAHDRGRTLQKSFLENVLGIKTKIPKDGFKVKTEERLWVSGKVEGKSNKERRIDIAFWSGDNIKSPERFIPIEVKIFAGDLKDQCSDYYEEALRRLKTCKNGKGLLDDGFYYLTPDGRMPDEYSIGKLTTQQQSSIRPISFQEDILSWLRDEIKAEKAPELKETLIQFAQAIGSFSNATIPNKADKDRINEFLRQEQKLYCEIRRSIKNGNDLRTAFKIAGDAYEYSVKGEGASLPSNAVGEHIDAALELHNAYSKFLPTLFQNIQDKVRIVAMKHGAELNSNLIGSLDSGSRNFFSGKICKNPALSYRVGCICLDEMKEPVSIYARVEVHIINPKNENNFGHITIDYFIDNRGLPKGKTKMVWEVFWTKMGNPAQIKLGDKVWLMGHGKRTLYSESWLSYSGTKSPKGNSELFPRYSCATDKRIKSGRFTETIAKIFRGCDADTHSAYAQLVEDCTAQLKDLIEQGCKVLKDA